VWEAVSTEVEGGRQVALIVRKGPAAKVYFDDESGQFRVNVIVRGAFVPRRFAVAPVEGRCNGDEAFVCFPQGDALPAEVTACYRFHTWTIDVELTPEGWKVESAG
jgi:hypothetical protein